MRQNAILGVIMLGEVIPKIILEINLPSGDGLMILTTHVSRSLQVVLKS